MAKKKKDDDEPQEEASSGGSIAVNDAWTGMLAISLLALMIGTGFLAWDYMQYSDTDVSKVVVPKLTSKQPPAVKPAPEADKKEADKKTP